ncbi:ABC transporter ATP-binding protein/permease [Mesobacillus subterraneus]|uniref:ABC transporter ATP-binding protein n=1 Tax=Mesobacillus subterraneus TaxID=285983 RepID=UPI00203CBC00|nr:ABC transporter ATP-binding protein [Mesobacillus subterraneus]MCM3665252.1 ABC transporter ATP-binding protein/permease [Mesobacillus subterraneus]MCM3684265.1 ABC transporter ATP-binding protein/permease [Mesobacillus subterraneus]
MAKIEQLVTIANQYFSMKDIRKTFSMLKPFFHKHWKAYSALLFLLGFDIFFTLAFAWFFGNITDAAIRSDFEDLKRLIPIGIGLTVLNIISNFCDIYFETIASNGLKKDLKEHLFKHILSLPAGIASNLRSGDLLSYFTNDIHSIDGVTGSSLINLIRLPITYIAVLIYLFQINWVLCLISVLIAPIAIVAGAGFGLLLKRNGRKLHSLIAEINNTLNETFQGFQVIRSFTLEKKIFEKFTRENDDYFKLELENAKLQGWYYSGGYLISSVVFLTCLSLGAYFVYQKEMTIGSLLTFTNLVGYLVYPLTGIAGQWAGFQRSITAIERIIDLVEKPVASSELPAYSPVKSNIKSIEFKSVTFSYDENKTIFSNLNLQIEPGKMVALVGPSGAGKTTLFNLLQGFYQPQLGQILIDGISTDEMTLSELRSAIAHVPQETFLFAGSIRDNLLMARPGITEFEMIEAAKQACIHEFIIGLPEGYDSEIGERGIKLSGGQKQRIAIARAILKDAPILLLDEATSALDSNTESMVKQALEHLMKDKTTIVIAHRLSTIQNADQIVVLDEGEVVQIGTHVELIAQEGLYQKLNATVLKPKKAEHLYLVSK